MPFTLDFSKRNVGCRRAGTCFPFSFARSSRTCRRRLFCTSSVHPVTKFLFSGASARCLFVPLVLLLVRGGLFEIAVFEASIEFFHLELETDLVEHALLVEELPHAPPLFDGGGVGFLFEFEDDGVKFREPRESRSDPDPVFENVLVFYVLRVLSEDFLSGVLVETTVAVVFLSFLRQRLGQQDAIEVDKGGDHLQDSAENKVAGTAKSDGDPGLRKGERGELADHGKAAPGGHQAELEVVELIVLVDLFQDGCGNRFV
mmetsp:Transcript_15902/g.32600  ORF Transcript_15902/g.32600 Transcript_15902/m.32600 type:complete len:259 (+) Transcript_15902:1528-2304(+)